MAYSSFEVDNKTLTAITEMKVVFGVKTAAQVIRKALALARVASEYLDENGNLTILDKQGEPLTILMAS